MGLINIYDTVSNKHTSIRATGKIKDILPEIDFSHSLILKAGTRLDENYSISDDDVLYVRKVPGATAVAVIAVVVAVVAVGVAVGASVYANKKAEEARRQMEEAQRNAKNLAQQTRQLPFIRGAKNRCALGEAVQFVMGSVYNTPYNLTNGFYSIGGSDGTDSYYNAVFSCGFNSQKITEILLGNESICRRSEGIDGVLPFDPTSIYYGSSANSVEVRQPGSTITMSGCNQKISSTYSGAELKHNFEEDAIPVIVQAAENAMRIEVCVQFSALREYDSEHSNWKAREVKVTPAWSNDGGANWHEFEFSGVLANTISRNVNHTIRFVASKTFSPEETLGKQISIRVVKDTPKKEQNTQEDCCLLWYQTFCYDAQKSSNLELVPCWILENELYAKTTKIAYRVKADDSTQDIIDELHCITEGYARTWNGSAWSSSKTPTRNPASWLLEVLTSDVHKSSQFSDSQLDLPSFGALYEYCSANNFYCDAVISQSEKKRDIIEKILKLCNASLIINNEGLYEVCIDKLEENPVALLNAENIVSFSFSKSLAKKVDGTKVTFTNRNSWTVDTFYSMLDGGSYNYVDDTVDTLAIDYVTDYTHAYKMAQRQLRQRQLQPREIKVDVGHEGDYYPLYSTVLLQLPHLLQGLRSSVIKGIEYNTLGAITKIEISDLVDFMQDTRYGVIIQATNDFGHKMYSAEVINTETSGSTRLLTFAEPLSLDNESIVPERGNHLSFGTLDSNGRFSKITNVMKIYGVEPNGKDGFTLSLRDYNPDVYAYTPSGVPIPSYKSNVTAPQNRAKSVTLNDLNELRNQMNKAIDGILIKPEDIGNPPIVENLSAVATETGITLKWTSIPSTGLQNAIKHYLVEISKDSGTTWEELSPSGTNQYFFSFIRSGSGAVGYPEADVFETWRFRVKAENVYGKKSVEWTSTLIDVTEYGTWIPQQPVIATPRVSHRNVTLNFSQKRVCYGEVYFLVSIQRYDEYRDAVWFKPDLETDPYSSVFAYKDTNATDYFVKDGVTYYYLKSANSFTQTLPLEKQLAEGYLEVHKGQGVLEKLQVKTESSIEMDLIVTRNYELTESVDTNYYYRVWCFNATTGVISELYTQVLITAKATSAYDIVDAAIITNKLADEAVTLDKLHANSVTAEKLVSRNLTSLGAFIGNIYGADIDDVEYLRATVYQPNVEYYVYNSATGSYEKPVIQPTAETFDQGTYYIRNPNWGMPKETADNYWKGLDSDTPEFRIGNDINAEIFEFDNDKTNTEANYIHYLSAQRTFQYSFPDPDTHVTKTGSYTLAKGLYFKIANFIVTAINSIIRGVFFIKSGTADRKFVEVNPETGVEQGVTGETMKINGDITIGKKADGTTNGSLTVAGAATVGSLAVGGGVSSSGISASGTISATGVASDVEAGRDIKATRDVRASQDIIASRNITATGTVSGAGVSSSGDIAAAGTVSGANVTATGTISGSHVRVPVGTPANPQAGEIWVAW